MCAYYLAIDKLPLGDAVTLFFFNPALTAVAAWAVLHEPLGWVGVVGLFLSLAGLVCLTQPPFLFGGQDVRGGRGVHDRRALLHSVTHMVTLGICHMCVASWLVLVLGKKHVYSHSIKLTDLAWDYPGV